MTEYSYRFWKTNRGLEEQQAEVFNQANDLKFRPSDAEKIKKYFQKIKPNPKHVRYAFRGEKMVGYIHARIQEQVKELVLSYPWTIPDTPTNVRDTLFDEMIQYFRSEDKFSDFQFRVNMFVKEANVKFIESRGFTVQNTWKELLLPLNEVANAEYNAKYTSRMGTEQDIPELISLIKEDGSYDRKLKSDEQMRNFLQEEVLPTKHLILVYEGEILTAACAPTEAENRIIMDFAVFKNVKDQAPFIPLFVELAKACMNSGYGKNKPITVYTDNMETTIEEQKFLQKFTPVHTKNLMYYHYLKV